MPVWVINNDTGKEERMILKGDHPLFTEWDRFLATQQAGNIYQTGLFYSTYSLTKFYDPCLVIVLSNGVVAGGVLGVIQRYSFGVFSRLTARGLVLGGPVVSGNDPRIVEKTLNILQHEFRGKALYVQIRSLSDPSHMAPLFHKAGFKTEDHLNILLDLTQDEGTLWARVNSKRKNEIRKGQKSGLVVTEKSDHEGMAEAYSILTEVYSRARIPLPEPVFFNNLLGMNGPSSGLRIFLGYLNEEVAGCMLVLVYPGRVIDYYAGSYSRFYSKCPNDFITWEVVKWSVRMGYQVFDFGGAGKPGDRYGVRDFKLKFGGDLVSLPRFEKVLNPFMMKIASAGYHVWRTVKGIFK